MKAYSPPERSLIGVDSLMDITDKIMRENGFALTECEHGVHVNQLCPTCDPESALEAQQQAEECSEMNVFHRY